MTFYLIIWILLLFFSARDGSRILLWGSIVILSLIAGARAVHIGTDTQVYHGIFSLMEGGVELSYLEPGWLLLNKLVIATGLSYNWLLWIVSFATLGCLGWAATRESPNPNFSLFVYYGMYAYLNSFNIMRQLLAVSIVLIGFHFLRDRKFLACGLTILLAATFHKSALIAFAAFPLLFAPMRRGVFYLTLGVTFLLGVAVGGDLFWWLPGEYGDYLAAGNTQGYRENLFSVAATAFALNGFAVFLYHNADSATREDLWFKLFWAAVLLTNLTMGIVLGTRIIIYFTIAQTILFPMLLWGGSRYRRLVGSLVVLYLLAVFVKILSLGNSAETGVVPYATIINYPY